MAKVLITLLLIASLSIGAYYYFSGKNIGFGTIGSPKPKISVSSQAFLNRSSIPAKFTCDGENISPPLTLDRIPGDAKSLVLIVDDPDAGKIPFTHWIVFNIETSSTNIEEGKVPNALEGTNDFGDLKYDGPCPTGTHKYHFRVYALDGPLALEEGAKRSEIDSAMVGHIVAQGETVGVYTR